MIFKTLSTLVINKLSIQRLLVLCLVVFLSLFIGFIPCVNATIKQQGQTFSQKLLTKNGSRFFETYIPQLCQSKSSYPLVIVLHGGGENIPLIKKITGMNNLADTKGFIVIYPQGTGRFKKRFFTWNAIDCCGFSMRHNIDDVGFISQVIDYAIKNYAVDPHQVYVTGFSNGGMLAYRLACAVPEKIAAIAVVGGSMSGKETQPAGSSMPVLIIHGTKDTHVPFNGGAGKLAKYGYPVNRKSVSYAVNFWKAVNNCSENSKVTAIGKITKEIFSNESNNVAVELITIDDFKHAWPGGKKAMFYTDSPRTSLNASEVIWNFFNNQR